jgi:hypothetical protein
MDVYQVHLLDTGLEGRMSDTFNDVRVPPLGLRPRYVWHEQVLEPIKHARIAEILRAMQRYLLAERPIPGEWLDELSGHVNSLRDPRLFLDISLADSANARELLSPQPSEERQHIEEDEPDYDDPQGILKRDRDAEVDARHAVSAPHHDPDLAAIRRSRYEGPLKEFVVINQQGIASEPITIDEAKHLREIHGYRIAAILPWATEQETKCPNT